MEKIIEMKLDDNIIKCIKHLVKEIKETNGIENEIIRDDVFTILQNYCTVLYYPIENEKNKAFHIQRYIGDNFEEVVFINTAHHKEKQIFGAAHELGHIWKVDEQVQKKLGITLSAGEKEAVINRFAAELLMPENSFRNAYHRKCEELKFGKEVSLAAMLKLITYLMNYFYVPFMSVVIRMSETEQISKGILEILGNKYEENETLLTPYIKEAQYTRLQIVNKLKSIDNLPEMLREAEKKELLTDSQVQYLKKKFDFENEIEDASEEIIYDKGKGNY